MENKFRLPFAYHEGSSSEKHSNLLQIMLVLSSGILSSSAIATVVKAWLDTRKTTLTIQIDGDRKTLQYEGHHLKEDAATIQTVFDTLNEDTKVAQSIGTVITLLTDDRQKEKHILASGSHQEHISHGGSEQAGALQPPSFLQRLLPGWLHR
jgi:hypothetical protein